MELTVLEDSRAGALDFRSPVPGWAPPRRSRTLPRVRFPPPPWPSLFLSRAHLSFRFPPTTHPFLSSVFLPSLFPALLSARSLCRSPWYALRFAARGGAPLSVPHAPRRVHAGRDVTTAPNSWFAEGGQPPLATPSRTGISAASRR